MMKKMTIVVAISLMALVAEQVGEWRMHSRFEKKVGKMYPTDAQVREVVRRWMADEGDKRTFKEFSQQEIIPILKSRN